MPRFPIASSTQAGRGLFVPEEVRQLMWAECARAQRCAYASTLMAIGIDRLEQLGDLYGIESRANILGEVGALLRASIRQSDLIGSATGNLFLALFPHAPREVGPVIARRLLERSRRLVFDEGHSAVQTTLSLGLAHREIGATFGLDELVDEARAAQARALSSGGNRYLVHVAAPQPVHAPATVVPDLDEIGKALERIMSERVRELFASMGEKLPDFGGHEREVLELAVQKLERERALRESEYRSEIDMLQRRLAKLAGSLQLTEGELQRVMAMKSIDPGVASIYRTVQGLSVDEADAERKKEMMAKIFEANVELRKKLSGEGR